MIIRIVLLVILLAFRFYDIGARAPHHDEAVNGWFVDGIFNRGYYQYDPGNYHGPLYFYVLTLITKIFGRSIETLRYAPLVFGTLTTLTPMLFRKWIGERGMWAAIFFLAVSPAMVFYSRYSIHEMMFTFACIIYFYYWLKVRSMAYSWKNAVGLGAALGAMACLKENFILYIASLIIAEVLTQGTDFGFSIGKTAANLKAQLTSKNFWTGFVITVGLAFCLIFIFYSALGQDQNGFVNFFKAFVFWSDTGSKGNGHQKSFFYWIQLMGQFEWMALLGLILTPFALKRVPSELRLTSIVSFGLWLAYSIVNYKTPWCVLSYFWGLILVAAYWIDVWMKPKGRVVPIALVLVAGYSVSAYQAYDAAYAAPDQEGHLYIYGQTFSEFMIPMNELLAEGRANPEIFKNRRIQIVSTYTWPLPYVLGDYKQVGYHGENNAPEVFDGDVLMFDEAIESKYVPKIKDLASYRRIVVKSRQWASRMVVYRKK